MSGLSTLRREMGICESLTAVVGMASWGRASSGSQEAWRRGMRRYQVQ